MKRIAFALGASTLLALSVASCSRDSTSPSSPPPTNTTPTVTGLTISGTAPIINFIAQFHATASLSNGTSEVVTNLATWQSTDPGVAAITVPGRLLGVAAGETEIRATYGAATGILRITVAPVHRLFGWVYQAGTSTTIPGVLVKITSGFAAGSSTLTDAGGGYSLSNLPHETFTAEGSKSGYIPSAKSIALSADSRVDFVLATGSASPPIPTPPPSPPVPPSPPPGSNQCAVFLPIFVECGVATAVCNDNTYSCSQNRAGTCSQRGGVKCWICPGPLCSP